MSTMLRVLTYHRIAEEGATFSPPSLISATPRDFAAQVADVAASYTPVCLGQVAEALHFGRPLPHGAVLFTFDDGYRDFAQVAWPVLRRFGVRPALFVPTAHAHDGEHAFWWDRLYRALLLTRRADVEIAGERVALGGRDSRDAAFRRAKAHLTSLNHDALTRTADALCEELGVADDRTPAVLDWPALRRLQREGVDIGAHARTHPLLTKLDTATARTEIEGSLADVQRELGPCVPAFCYPAGAYDDRIVSMVAQAGAALAFTVDRGHNRVPGTHPLRLRRTGVTRRTGVLLLRARLTRAGAVADRWREHATARARRHAQAGA